MALFSLTVPVENTGPELKQLLEDTIVSQADYTEVPRRRTKIERDEHKVKQAFLYNENTLF